MGNTIKTILTIAGSDCSGGAGIQVDIKTITMHRMYAMSVLTALTAQNTTGVNGIMQVPPDFVCRQLDAVFSDIRPDAIKIGMVPDAAVAETISDRLQKYKAKNIVLDPVFVSTTGCVLQKTSAFKAFTSTLLPVADIVTPNLSEAERLSGHSIQSKGDMLLAAEKIAVMFSGAVLVKGGHLQECADDLLYAREQSIWLSEERISNSNTHGTGCTLSSAIACNLASGLSMEDSIKKAKRYITELLRIQFSIGQGNGPLAHPLL